MRLAPARDLSFTARPTKDSNRVLIALGAYRFTCTKSEAIQLARELVTSVDELAIPNGAQA